jgi:hypothetical protein
MIAYEIKPESLGDINRFLSFIDTKIHPYYIRVYPRSSAVKNQKLGFLQEIYCTCLSISTNRNIPNLRIASFL